MAENDELKKIAELYFGTDQVAKNLADVEKQLNSWINNLDSKYFKKLQTKFSGSFKLSGDTSSITKAAEKSMLRLNEIDAKRVATAARQDKALEIEQQKHLNKMEENEQKSLLRREEFSEKMAAKQQTMWDRIGNMANTYLTYQGFNALKRAAQEVIDEMVDVESQMVQIDRVLNEDSLNIDNYRDKLIGLAYDYGNSFDNVADITLRLAQAGFDSQQSLALTEKTLLALNTAELNATQATDDMIAVMSQWNLMTGSATEVADDYAMIIDKVNRVADNFPTTSADIMDALKKTSSAFNMAGASIDETIASIVAAEKASQRGGKAIGTALNSIVQQLKTDKRLDTMEALGIDLYTDETKTEFKSIMDIFAQLSEKMEQLKREGKESSVEMQNLLSVFTVLRRNIGGSFLGEMAGDDSTYNKVLELVQAYDTMGYSLQENEKYMKTAKAAQEQFNATLLQLKTSVWENGAEDVFRSLLLLGTDIVKVFKVLIDSFGTLPTTIGMVTLAFSLFNKELQLVKINEQGSAIELGGFLSKLKGATTQVKETTTALEGAATASAKLKVATMALNVAWSLGLSLAISGVLSLLDKFIHREENAIKKQQELIDRTNEKIIKDQQEAATIEKLIEDYEKYANIQLPENTKEREELVKKVEDSEKAITEYLIQNNKYTAEMNNNYGLQLETLKQINEENRKRRIEEAKIALAAAENKKTGLTKSDVSDGFFFGDDLYQLQQAGIDTAEYLGEYYQEIEKFAKLDFEKQYEALTKWEEQLRTNGQVTSEAYTWVSEKLEIVKKQMDDVDEATRVLNQEIVNQTFDKWLDNHDIKTLEDYKSALEDISQITPISSEYVGKLDDFRATMQQMAKDTFPEFNEEIELLDFSMTSLNTTLDSSLQQLDKYAEQYQILDSAVTEFNSTGQITSATLQGLINNNLLQYLDLTANKASINRDEFLNLGEAQKVQAIQALQSAAALDIEKVALGDIEGLSPIAKAAISSFGDAATKTGKQAVTSAKQIEIMAQALQNAHDAAKGKLGKGVKAEDFEKQSNAIMKAYTNYAKQISNLDVTSPLYSGKAGKGSSGGSAKQATKTFEEESKERVKIFKQEIEDLESLEKEWVNKYKKLELFGTSDLKFITHQRINRYNEYLNQINQLQGISEEDRAELTREYTAERQKLELEYFDLLKQQLDDQIKELQDANKEKIQLIKDEAQARIDALKQVEDENDRIRQKEEYEAKRQELLHGYQGVEYWRQRTGREAQLALAEAEKKLAELDQDWEDKKKDWTLEEQIEEIEKARDAQIAAIEEAQEQQIAGWKAAYKAQVDLYAQTGQIIYDNSVINAGYLYEAYMNNFVSPLHTKLQEVMNTINATNAATEASAARAREVAAGGISSGTTAQSNAAASSAAAGALTAAMAAARTISAKTAAQKILDTTSSVINSLNSKNLLNSLKKVTGKFHGGGKVGTNAPEALAVLRPKEVVLTPEWAAGMDKLVQQVNEGKLLNQTSSTTTQIDVNGNLVNIDADIKNKQDADYLTKQITKVLQDKFNIKK